MCAKSLQSTLCDPMDGSPPGSSSMGFPRQEHWSGLPFPPPGDLPDLEIEPGYPALAGGFLSLSHQGSPINGISALIKETPLSSQAASVM